MIPGWVKSRWGWSIAATVSIAGALWFAEDRRTIQAQDVLELVEGLEERYRAAYHEVEFETTVTTQNVANWSEATNVFWYAYSGTNVIERPYLIRLTNDYEYVDTNTVQLEGYERGYTFHTFAFDYTFKTGRMIWSGWQTLLPYDIGPSFFALQPVMEPYTFQTNYGGYGWYTHEYSGQDPCWVIKDGGPSVGWTWYPTDEPPTNSNPSSWEGSLYQGYFCEPSDWSMQSNWVEYLFSTPVSGGLFGEDLDADAIKARGARVTYEKRPAIARLRPGSTKGDMDPFWVQFDFVLTNMVVPRYVNPETITTNGDFEYHTTTGLFEILQIGNTSNAFTGIPTNWHTGTNPTNELDTNFVFGVTNATYGPVGRIARSIHLEERYIMLNALTVTVGNVEFPELALESNWVSRASNVVERKYSRVTGSGGPWETSKVDSVYGELPQLMESGNIYPENLFPGQWRDAGITFGDTPEPIDFSAEFWTEERNKPRTFGVYPLPWDEWGYYAGWSNANGVLYRQMGYSKPYFRSRWNRTVKRFQEYAVIYEDSQTTFISVGGGGGGYWNSYPKYDVVLPVSKPVIDADIEVVDFLTNAALFTVNTDLTGVTFRVQSFARVSDYITGVVQEVGEYTTNISPFSLREDYGPTTGTVDSIPFVYTGEYLLPEPVEYSNLAVTVEMKHKNVGDNGYGLLFSSFPPFHSLRWMEIPTGKIYTNRPFAGATGGLFAVSIMSDTNYHDWYGVEDKWTSREYDIGNSFVFWGFTRCNTNWWDSEVEELP